MSSVISDGGYSSTDIQATQKTQTSSPSNQRLNDADLVSNDRFTSQKTNPKKKNNTGLWFLGGLGATIVALALIKKDGEPLLKLLFSRGKQETQQLDNMVSHEPPRADETLVDSDLGTHARDLIADHAEDLSRIGRRRIRDRIATRRNYRQLGEANFLTAQLTARRAQARAMVSVHDATEALAKAQAKYEAAIAGIGTNGNSIHSAAKEQRAANRVHTATLRLSNAMTALRQANQTAARHGL